MADASNPQPQKISRERLNQIAARKLTAMGISCDLGASGVLEGELVLKNGSVIHPATRLPISRARFTVLGHDHLTLSEPPLSALPAIVFYDVEYPDAIEERLSQALKRRMAALGELATRMQALKFEVALDPDNLQVRGLLRGAAHAFEFASTPDGVRLKKVLPLRGAILEIGDSYPPIKLSEWAAGIDLEIFLTEELATLKEHTGRAAETAAPKSRGLRQVDSGSPLTLGNLVERLGPGVTLQASALEFFQEFEFDGTKYRFTAVHETGTRFRGKLVGTAGERWAEKFDLNRFPGVLQLASVMLGAKSEEGTESHAPRAAPLPRPPAPAPASPAAAFRDVLDDGVPSHMRPTAGEVWVMNVLVEAEDANEVRYVCTDNDGKPYGATRLLKRADFESAFVYNRTGWQLPVYVDEVTDTECAYRRVDRDNQPGGLMKRIPLAIFASNFSPAAASY